MSKHNKKVALITGANKGIGFEISRQLAGKGITVVVGVRSEERGHTACSRLRDAGMDVHFQRINVTDFVFNTFSEEQRNLNRPA
jgi:NAD(P)-dependent dehydrogenase (short-subunit alcohol dehydrogenase family)